MKRHKEPVPPGFVENIIRPEDPRMLALSKPEWNKYGMTIYDWRARDCNRIRDGIKEHNKVQEYLDKNVAARLQYKKDQTGILRYYDILRLAENEGV